MDEHFLLLFRCSVFSWEVGLLYFSVHCSFVPCLKMRSVSGPTLQSCSFRSQYQRLVAGSSIHGDPRIIPSSSGGTTLAVDPLRPPTALLCRRFWCGVLVVREKEVKPTLKSVMMMMMMMAANAVTMIYYLQEMIVHYQWSEVSCSYWPCC